MKYPVIVTGVGPVPCDLMIVGEAPGRNEIATGKPFCGRSGQLLDDALIKAGQGRDTVYITNIFKGDVGKGNPNPSEEQIDDHIGFLRSEIQEVKPLRILTLGLTATRNLGFNPKVKMRDVSGKSITGLFGPVVYPCYHPAYILRNQKNDVVADFYSTIRRFVDGSFSYNP